MRVAGLFLLASSVFPLIVANAVNANHETIARHVEETREVAARGSPGWRREPDDQTHEAAEAMVAPEWKRDAQPGGNMPGWKREPEAGTPGWRREPEAGPPGWKREPEPEAGPPGWKREPEAGSPGWRREPEAEAEAGRYTPGWKREAEADGNTPGSRRMQKKRGSPPGW
ncbi:hypothetical protein C0995_002980 [Termitomyces sp. Mi166|nr:hypothetical protein C0995_002980 [Termitomyces sp. Mi166\